MDEKFGWLNDLNSKSGNSSTDEVVEMYEDLISLLVGSHYMTFKTPAYHPIKKILKTKESTIKNAKLTNNNPAVPGL